MCPKTNLQFKLTLWHIFEKGSLKHDISSSSIFSLHPSRRIMEMLLKLSFHVQSFNKSIKSFNAELCWKDIRPHTLRELKKKSWTGNFYELSFIFEVSASFYSHFKSRDYRITRFSLNIVVVRSLFLCDLGLTMKSCVDFSIPETTKEFVSWETKFIWTFI